MTTQVTGALVEHWKGEIAELTRDSTHYVGCEMVHRYCAMGVFIEAYEEAVSERAAAGGIVKGLAARVVELNGLVQRMAEVMMDFDESPDDPVAAGEFQRMSRFARQSYRCRHCSNPVDRQIGCLRCRVSLS